MLQAPALWNFYRLERGCIAGESILETHQDIATGNLNKRSGYIVGMDSGTLKTTIQAGESIYVHVLVSLRFDVNMLASGGIL